MKKRILTALLASTMVFALAACGNQNAEQGDNGDQGSKTLTVGIWGGNDGESKAINQVVADFEEKMGCTVELKVYTDYNTQIQADFIGGTAPDVFYIDGNVFPFYSTLGVMEPLDAEEMGLSSYYENLVDAFTAEDGTVYCVPKDVSTLAMYYNIDLLESVGYTPEDIPDDYDDFKPFLTDLQAKLDEKYGANAIAAMTYNQDLSRNLILLENGGASLIDENDNATLTSDTVVKNMEYIMDFVKAGLWKTPADLGLGWNGEAFGTGKAVIMEEGNWVYGTLKNDYSDINFGVKEMPTYNGEQKSMSFTVGYGIYANSPNKDLAKEWIKYATGVEGMTTWCSGAGCLPSRADVAEAMGINDDPVWAVHSAMTEIARPWQLGTTATIINTAYQNYFPLMVSGEMSAQEALQAAQDQANSEIANAG